MSCLRPGDLLRRPHRLTIASRPDRPPVIDRQPSQPILLSPRAILSSLFSFEALLVLYMFAGIYKSDPRFAWLPVDATALFFALSVLVGSFIIVRNPIHKKSLPVVFAMVCLVAWLWVSLMWSPSRIYGPDKVFQMATLVLWAVIAGAVIIAPDPERVRRLFTLMLLLALLGAVDAVLGYAGSGGAAYTAVRARSEVERGRLSGAGPASAAPARWSRLPAGCTAAAVAGGVALSGPVPRPRLRARDRRRPRSAALDGAPPADPDRRSASASPGADTVLAHPALGARAVVGGGWRPRTVRDGHATKGWRRSTGWSGWRSGQPARASCTPSGPGSGQQAPLLGHGAGSWPLLMGRPDQTTYPHNLFLELMVENRCGRPGPVSGGARRGVQASLARTVAARSAGAVRRDVVRQRALQRDDHW